MKLKGTLHTNRNRVSRQSSGAVHSTLENLGGVIVNTTLGESGGVSLRIEINGKVAFNEHFPIEELLTFLANRT